MSQLPTTLEESIALAQTATLAAIAAGHQRITVEIVIPELKSMGLARQFIESFSDRGNALKVLFPDTGAAALAKRDWQDRNFKIDDLGSSRSPVEDKIQAEDQLFIAIEPSAVEVAQVEKLCNAAGDRPVILFLPKLEDAAIVGIGYAARQLRDRFLTTLTCAYYIKPLETAAIYRCYPGQWQVWLEGDNDYTLISESPAKPVGDELDALLVAPTAPGDNAPAAKSPGIFASLGRFLRTLSR
ncbi:DUF1995 family protein [Chamaesiphon sp. VAR_69_metabat_338]|uniref:DUF1995 family protein n=1 Tax=Chamaesiphon sp. VAR_69_metabat_338 TaxID=2964704 RepID=UPI00286DD80F|nr:DUF1995 family protein [Chamaesiphon sp. VAR_69_metabat_338]